MSGTETLATRELAARARDALLALTVDTQDPATLQALATITLALRDQGVELDRLRDVERAARAVVVESYSDDIHAIESKTDKFGNAIDALDTALGGVTIR